MNPFTAGLHYSAVAIFIGAFLYWILRCMSNKWCKGKSDNLCAKLLTVFFAISIPALCCVPAGGALGMVTGCAAGTAAAFGGADLLRTEVEVIMQDTSKPLGKYVKLMREHGLAKELVKIEAGVKNALAGIGDLTLDEIQCNAEKQLLLVTQSAKRRRLTSPPT